MIPSPVVWVRGYSSPQTATESYEKTTDRRIFVSQSKLAKSLGTLTKSVEISVKWLWIQGKNRISLSPPDFFLGMKRA